MTTKRQPTIKTKKAGPKISPERMDEGMRAALDLTGEISFCNLWSSSTEMLNERHLREIATAIDPVRYSEDQKEFKRAELALTKTLTPEQRHVLVQYQNACCSREYWIELAGFYYGCAFVQTIGGGLNGPGGRRRS